MPSYVIASYEYGAETESLTITFVSGKVYRYFNVPPELYRQFTVAFSKGNFFNKYIKPGRDFKQLTGKDK